MWFLGVIVVVATACWIPALGAGGPGYRKITGIRDHRITRNSENEGKSLPQVENYDTLAENFLKEVNDKTEEICTRQVVVAWDHATNLTEENRLKEIEVGLESAKWYKTAWRLYKTWDDHLDFISDDFLKRQFELNAILGSSALSPEELKEYKDTISQMETIYSKAKICDYNDREKCDLSLDPDITNIYRKSRNASELSYVWKAWRDASGKKIRNLYKTYVRLSNKVARLNGKRDTGDMWLHPYNEDSDAFREDLAELYNQLKPLYVQLHAYVRRKLRELYGSEIVTERGPIPANLLGNNWAQSWDQIYDELIPYPGKSGVDVTEEMKKQGYTAKKMFEMSDDFFASLNLTRMPPEFWEHSVIEKPDDRDIVCHASAWDFCNKVDFRIKQCTQVAMEDFIVVHHEMGHIQYYLQYKHLPDVFRTGANPGFHEAVGDVLSLSVATPKHLHKVGLLPEVINDDEADINFLLNQALSGVAFLPFGYLMELWRWDVFSGKTAEKDWNCEWWALRSELQGVKPPVVRTENDFDPGAKYHIPSSVGYIRYFVARVLQYQFYKSMCVAAGEYDPNDPEKPLHRCDIYQSLEAGKLLGDMLKLGASKPWEDALEGITGQRKMDASVLREYFKPLEDWLIADNKKHNQYIGWRADGQYCLYEEPPQTARSQQCPN